MGALGWMFLGFLALLQPIQAQDLSVKPGLDAVDSLYQLQVIPNAQIADLPSSGTNLVIIAKLESGELYFRIFNSVGVMMADIAESQIVFGMSTYRPAQLDMLKEFLTYKEQGNAMNPEHEKWMIHYVRHTVGLMTTAELKPSLQGNLETVENLRGLSGLLAGFMIAVVFTLTHLPRRPVIAWTLVMTASSAAGFIVSAFICTFLVIICNNTLNNMMNEVQMVDYYVSLLASTLQTWAGGALILTLLSSLPFAGAISLSGWIYSKFIGLLTTLIGMVSLFLMAFSVGHVIWAMQQ